MLEPQGNVLLSAPWGVFQRTVTLHYYDGPRLLLRQSPAGQQYLAWWSDTDGKTERWVYLPASPQRVSEILIGIITSREALDSPEDGFVYVVDVDLDTLETTRVMQTTTDRLDPEALPVHGARLQIQAERSLIDLPVHDQTHLLVTQLQSGDPHNPRVGAKVVGLYLGALQRLVDSIGQALSGQATLRGSIPATILSQTRLNAVVGQPGSFTLYLEAQSQDDMFGESLARKSFEALFDLIDVGSDFDGLVLKFDSLKGRVAKNYDDMLQVLSTSVPSAWLGWSQQGVTIHRYVELSDQKAHAIQAIIEDARRTIREDFTVVGELNGGNVRTMRFEITDTLSGERFFGRVDEEAESELRGTSLGSTYEAVLEPQIELSIATGEERTTYVLKSIRPQGQSR